MSTPIYDTRLALFPCKGLSLLVVLSSPRVKNAHNHYSVLTLPKHPFRNAEVCLIPSSKTKVKTATQCLSKQIIMSHKIHGGLAATIVFSEVSYTLYISHSSTLLRSSYKGIFSLQNTESATEYALQ
jgi:hypothetical protein